MNREYKPLKLMPNVIYPTYQLHAEVANNETSADDAMKIVILEVMAWLRERFRDLDMPQKIQMPPSDQYMNFDLSQVESFNADGKLHESPLDYHLKVGNDSEKLLRIYFLFDGDKKIIVVGSLPKHLPTLSYS